MENVSEDDPRFTQRGHLEELPSIPSARKQANALPIPNPAKRLPPTYPSLLERVDHNHGLWMAHPDIRRSQDDAAVRWIF